MNSKNYTIEEKYDVEQGEDWLTVMMAAPFQRGQRVEFVQGGTRRSGTVIDVAYGTFVGVKRYDIRVQYDTLNMPRWTHPQWLHTV